MIGFVDVMIVYQELDYFVCDICIFFEHIGCAYVFVLRKALLKFIFSEHFCVKKM